MSLYSFLQKNQNLLNKQELSILNYLMNNMSEIENKTLKEVAEMLYISPNTVVRMAKKLGYKGYTELKLSIQIEGHKKNMLQKKKEVTLFSQIQKSEELLHPELLKKIISFIIKSTHVYFFSCGPSKYPCEEMKEKLRILGFDSSLYFEPHVMNQRAKQLKSDDLVFVVSLSGETKTPLEAIRIAQLTEATTISITGFSQNSIAKLADISVYTFYEKSTYMDMDISSRIGIHFILNYIFESLVSEC